ncbi:hypothetical protein WK61_23220 [Burkholderia ubonensis]|nr:hypothetical protein WK61_23220 [Burkholderia ubonensis]
MRMRKLSPPKPTAAPLRPAPGVRASTDARDDGAPLTTMHDYRYAGTPLQRRTAASGPASADAVAPARASAAMPGPASTPGPAIAPDARAEPARDGAHGLPAPLRHGIERLSGVTLDHVRVHYNSTRPARWQAQAYAQASEIHLAPGAARHLPHEAWHLVQQAQGRAPATARIGGVALNDDARLEREADVMGARARSQGIAADAARTARPAGPARAKGASPPVVQAKLVFNKTQIGDDEQAVAGLIATLAGADAIQDPALRQAFTEYLEADPARLKHVITKWAGAPAHKSIKGDFARPQDAQPKAKVRNYEDADSLAFALLAEAHSKQKKQDEKAYATEVMNDPAIYASLVKLINEQIPKALLSYEMMIGNLGSLTPKNRRTYLEYVRTDADTSVMDVLRAPGKHTFGELVAAIHDVQELLYQVKNEELLPTHKDETARNLANPHALPPERYQGSVFVGMSAESPNGMPVITRAPVDRKWRGSEATPRPSDPHVRTAMLLGNPTDMGPSMTAARMFVLATHGGATSSQIHALALALFAFWNRIYRRDITDVHRYHFTMDMAANFGVSYSPFAAIDKRSREKQEAFHLRDVESEFDEWD